MYTPVNASFTISKWGLRRSKLYWHVFVMDKDANFLHADNKDSDQIAWTAQANLSLRWAHMSGGTLSHVGTH